MPTPEATRTEVRVELPWPDRAALRSVLDYNPETGIFIRTKKTGQNVVVGSEAGWIDRQGYRRLRFQGRSLQAHRVAWTYHYGTEPPKLIDHINGDRSDNRIANLRAADSSINTQNLKRARADNRLGLLGVRRRRDASFEARIMVGGRAHYLGSFCTAEAAHLAYVQAKRKLHPGGTL